jgi:hypothetical protein
MVEECDDIKRQADQAADEYYPVLTQWAVSGAQDENLRQEARRRAGVFRGALDWLIDCYRRVHHSIRARRALDHTVELRQLVDNDIENLDRYSPEIAGNER